MQSVPAPIQMLPFMSLLAVVKELAITMFYVTASVAAIALARWLNHRG